MGMAYVFPALADLLWNVSGTCWQWRQYCKKTSRNGWMGVGSLIRIMMTIWEEDVADLFRKYTSVLADEPIDIDYQSVENGA